MKTHTYKGYRIEEDASPLGIAFSITRPGERFVCIGVWSLPDAKRAIRQDLKELACSHEFPRSPFGTKGLYVTCDGCGKHFPTRRNAIADA